MKTWSIIKDVINTKNKTPQVVNLSLMVILSLTVAKVILIFKSGDSAQISSYGPVSALSFFSKGFESVMYARLCCFIEKYD